MDKKLKQIKTKNENTLSIQENILEMLKTTVRNENASQGFNNPEAFKMFDSFKENSEFYTELLTCAILNKNMSVINNLLNSKNESLLELPSINPASLAQEFYHLKGIADAKTVENKENYILVDCPYPIQAAISDSMEVFNLFKKTSVNTTGHIGLSKKKKNSIVSNAFGAACYYGAGEIAKNLIQGEHGVDLKFKTQERNAKRKTMVLTKEVTGLFPAMLALYGEGSDDFIVELFRLLKSKGDLKTYVDNEGNNLLHVAARQGRFKVIVSLVEEHGFNVSELNNEGQTPISIAQSLDYTTIRDYLNKHDQSSIPEDFLDDLLQDEESAHKKNKGKKRRKKTDETTGLLNTGGFEQTIKIQVKPEPIRQTPTVEATATPVTPLPVEAINNNVQTSQQAGHLKVDKEDYEKYKLEQKLKKERKQKEEEELKKKQELEDKLAKQKMKEHNKSKKEAQQQQALMQNLYSQTQYKSTIETRLETNDEVSQVTQVRTEPSKDDVVVNVNTTVANTDKPKHHPVGIKQSPKKQEHIEDHNQHKHKVDVAHKGEANHVETQENSHQQHSQHHKVTNDIQTHHHNPSNEDSHDTQHKHKKRPNKDTHHEETTQKLSKADEDYKKSLSLQLNQAWTKCHEYEKLYLKEKEEKQHLQEQIYKFQTSNSFQPKNYDKIKVDINKANDQLNEKMNIIKGLEDRIDFLELKTTSGLSDYQVQELKKFYESRLRVLNDLS